MAVVRKTFNTKPKPEPTYVERTCVIDGCGQTFLAKVQRGRPRKYCDTHLHSQPAQIKHRARQVEVDDDLKPYMPGYVVTGEKRTDYLEFLLRSRGTHIEQYRNMHEM